MESNVTMTEVPWFSELVGDDECHGQAVSPCASADEHLHHPSSDACSAIETACEGASEDKPHAGSAAPTARVVRSWAFAVGLSLLVHAGLLATGIHLIHSGRRQTPPQIRFVWGEQGSEEDGWSARRIGERVP